MTAFVIRRICLMLPVLLFVSLIAFISVRVMPGDIAVAKLGPAATPEAVQQLRQEMGLDKPLIEQYGEWVGHVARGDLGASLVDGQPVGGRLWSSIPPTIEIAVAALLLGLVIGVSLGAVAALRTGRPIDYIVRIIAVLGLAIPGFWVALMVLTFLARSFNWIPPLQYQSLFSHPIANIQMLGIPVIILAFNVSAVIMRLARGSLLEVFRQDYIRTARAKGLSHATLVNRHALRNALIPVITVIGVQLGFLLGGVVVLEQIFSIPGLGNFTFQAINTRDYPAIQAAVLFIAIAFVLVNLLVDLAYVAIDPRVSLT